MSGHGSCSFCHQSQCISESLGLSTISHEARCQAPVIYRGADWCYRIFHYFSLLSGSIVPVLKGDRTVRICGDYKLTVNQASTVDSYPLPRINDLFQSLSGGQQFSKIDLSHAYQQLVLDSRPSIHIEVYISILACHLASPLPLQCSKELWITLLQGLKHVAVYIDDIVVTGTSKEEHLRTLEEALRRLSRAGARLKKSKCCFFPTKVEFLGHLIDAQGLHPTPSKTKAIMDAPSPKSVPELKSFSGMLNYYCKILPNLSSTLHPLYCLLQKSSSWSWGPCKEEVFLKAKDLLSSPRVLAHFDPNRKLVLSCDASPFGLGAVLS